MFWMDSKLENESKLAAYRLRRWKKTKQKKVGKWKFLANTFEPTHSHSEGVKWSFLLHYDPGKIHQPKAQDSNDQSLSEYSKEEYQTNNNNNSIVWSFIYVEPFIHTLQDHKKQRWKQTL